MIPFEHYIYSIVLFSIFGYVLLFFYRKYLGVRYIFLCSALFFMMAYAFISKGEIQLEKGSYDLGLIASGFLVLAIYSISEGFRKIRKDES